VAIVLVAQLMLVLDVTVVNVALPRIDTDLGFGPASLSWVLNAYTLAFGGLLLLGGRLGDVRGRLRLFEIGLAVFTFSSMLGGLAQTPTQLVLARAAQGAGAAMAAPSVLALLTTSTPDEAARNRALALFGAVSSGGASIGLLLGGLVTDIGSWRWTLFINVPIGIAVLLLARRFVTETPRRPGRFDVVGAVTATLGAVSVVWALIGTPEHGWASGRTLGALALGLVSLGLLARTELRHPHPMIQPHLVRNRRRVAALAAMALVIGANLSMFFLVVQYDERVLGFGPFATGVAFLPFSLGVFAMSRVTPWLIARIGPRAMILIGTLALVVGYTWLSGISATDSYFGAVFGPVLIAGLSTGFVFMPITATVLGGVEPEHAGSASGLLQTTQQLGSAV
jgi:EmrB/QacA subfamily drug resistance transporter